MAEEWYISSPQCTGQSSKEMSRVYGSFTTVGKKILLYTNSLQRYSIWIIGKVTLLK